MSPKTLIPLKKNEQQPQKSIRNQKGQGVMEYLIITSLIGIVSIVAVKTFGKTVKEKISDIKEKLNEEIKID